MAEFFNELGAHCYCPKTELQDTSIHTTKERKGYCATAKTSHFYIANFL